MGDKPLGKGFARLPSGRVVPVSELATKAMVDEALRRDAEESKVKTRAKEIATSKAKKAEASRNLYPKEEKREYLREEVGVQKSNLNYKKLVETRRNKAGELDDTPGLTVTKAGNRVYDTLTDIGSEKGGFVGGHLAGLVGGILQSPYTVAGGVMQYLDPRSTGEERGSGVAEAIGETAGGAVIGKIGAAVAKPLVRAGKKAVGKIAERVATPALDDVSSAAIDKALGRNIAGKGATVETPKPKTLVELVEQVENAGKPPEPPKGPIQSLVEDIEVTFREPELGTGKPVTTNANYMEHFSKSIEDLKGEPETFSKATPEEDALEDAMRYRDIKRAMDDRIKGLDTDDIDKLDIEDPRLNDLTDDYDEKLTQTLYLRAGGKLEDFDYVNPRDKIGPYLQNLREREMLNYDDPENLEDWIGELAGSGKKQKLKKRKDFENDADYTEYVTNLAAQKKTDKPKWYVATKGKKSGEWRVLPGGVHMYSISHLPRPLQNILVQEAQKGTGAKYIAAWEWDKFLENGRKPAIRDSAEIVELQGHADDMLREGVHGETAVPSTVYNNVLKSLKERLIAQKEIDRPPKESNIKREVSAAIAPEPQDVPSNAPTSARQADVQVDRLRMDQDILEKGDSREWTELVKNANPDKARDLLTKKGVWSDQDNANAVTALAKLKKEHADVLQEAQTLTGEALDDAAATMRRIEDEHAKLTEAIYNAGSEQGRALASRKLTLDENLDLLTVKSRARVARGRDLTEKETQTFKALVDRLETAEKKLAERSNRVPPMFRPGSTRRAVKDIAKDIEVAKQEAKDALRKATAGASANLGSLFSDEDLYRAVIKLVKLEAEAGVAQVAELAKRLSAHLDTEVTEDDVRELFKPRGKAKTPSTGAQNIADMKRELSLMDQIERLESGTPADKSPKATRARSQRVRELEAELAELQGRSRATREANREMERLSRKEGRAANRSEDYKTELQKQIAELEAGTYAPKSKAQRIYDRETELLRFKRDDAMRKLKAQMNAKDQTPFQQAGNAIKEGAQVIRGTVLGSDFGILTRQGLFSLSRPKSYGKGLKNAVKSLFSEANLGKIERDLNERTVNGQLARSLEKKAGLSRTDYFGEVNAQEELVINKVLDRLPEWMRPIVGSLSRGQHAFINTIRADIFDSGVRAGMDAEELALRAKFINNATGRGNIREVPALAQAIMTSPRYESSRWGMLGEPLRAIGNFGVDLAFKKGKINKAALANLQDMAVTAGLVYGTFKTAELAGYYVDWDPTSSDFLKMRKYDKHPEDGGTPGKEVWDITAGISPRIRDVVRAWVVITEPSYNKDLGTVAKGALVRTVAPQVKLPVEMESRRRQLAAGVAEKDVKNPWSGYSDEGEAKGWIQLTPLIVQGFNKALGEGAGVGGAASGAAREFIGGSVNRYDKPKPFMPEKAKKKDSKSKIGMQR